MRKQLKLLLLVATVVALFAMAMIVGSAAEIEVGDAASLQTEISKLTVGSTDTIKLTADITVTSSVTFNGTVVIDGDGHSITSSIQKMFNNSGTSTSSLTIKNATINANGSKYSIIYGTSTTSCPLTLDNCTVVVSNSAASTILMTKTTVTLNDVTYTGPANFVACGQKAGYMNVVVTGKSTFTSTATTGGLFSTRRVLLTVGSESGTGDDIIFNLNCALVAPTTGTDTAANQVVIHNGTFNMQTAAGIIDMSATTTTLQVTINGGTFKSDGADTKLFNLGTFGVTINAGKFELKNGAEMGTAAFSVASNKSGIVVDLDETSATAAAYELFTAEPWKSNATVTGLPEEKPEEVFLFELYSGETKIGEYVSFDDAFAQIKEGNGDTIKLLEDWTINASIAIDGLTFTIDGNGKKITSAVTYFTATTDKFDITLKNVAEMHVKKPATDGANGGRGGFMRLNKAPTTGSKFTIESCSVYTYGNRVIEGAGIEVTLKDTYLKAAGGFLTHNLAGTTNTLKILGTSTIEMYYHENAEPDTYTGLCDDYSSTVGTVNVIIGSEAGGDVIKFKFAEGRQLINTAGDNCTITIYSGTFELASETALCVMPATGKVTVYSGTFKLSGGATMGDVAFTPAAEADGDITFELGAGSSEAAVDWLLDGNWMTDGKALVNITGWDASAAGSFEFTAGGTYTYDQYLAMLPKTTPNAVYADKGTMYNGDLDADMPIFLSQGLLDAWLEENGYTIEDVEDFVFINFVIADGISTDGLAVLPFEIKTDIEVTLKDWNMSFAGTLGTVTAGKLVLENCQITLTEAGVPLIMVDGENASLKVTGGVYDAADLESTVVFQIGAADVSQPNSSATFENVTIWSSTTSSSAAIYVGPIGSLTVTNCLITPYKGVTKGDVLGTMPEDFANVNSVGIDTYAAVATITNTEVHGGGSGFAFCLRAGDVTITDVVIYCYRGLRVMGATVTVNSATLTSAPFNTNFRGIEILAGTVNLYSATFLNRTVGESAYNNHGSIVFAGESGIGVLNILGGTYECSAINPEGESNESALIFFTAAGTVNISEGVTLTFSGNGGSVIEIADGVAAKVNATGATINVTGEKVVIVSGGTAENVVFTDCVFKVSKAQEATLFAAAKLEGAALVVAPEGSKVTDTVTLDASALTVKYAGESVKLWAIGAGFENTGAGASIYVDTTANADDSGLRFESVIAQSVISEILAEAGEGAMLKYYTLIAPLDYVAKANGQFTKEALGEGNYVAIQAVNSLDTTDGVKFSGTLVSLNSFERYYAAVAMIEVVVGGTMDENGVVTGGTLVKTVYGDFNSTDNARTAQQVANDLINDAEGEYVNEYTTEQKAIVDKYAAGGAAAE